MNEDLFYVHIAGARIHNRTHTHSIRNKKCVNKMRINKNNGRFNKNKIYIYVVFKKSEVMVIALKNTLVIAHRRLKPFIKYPWDF